MLGIKDLFANTRVSIVWRRGKVPEAKFLIPRKWSLASKAVTSSKSIKFQAYYSPYCQTSQIVLNYEKSKLRHLSVEALY